ncbi:phage terminase large subunit [Salinicoccus sp. ID82-1]|nr:phage terminase large subunit [Salinicoccus sp. ID82-1]
MQLTKEQRQTVAAQAKAELSKRYYRDYIVTAHHGNYEHYPHTELICKYLQRIADGETLNIMIEMPPRHGKSMTVTETFPSFYLAKNPNKRAIAAAYSDNLAKKFGRLNRNKFNEFSHLFGLTIAEDKNAAGNWGIAKYTGGMIATGIGGSITGEGADLMLVDDPIKNNEEAQSVTIRNKIWDEWESTLSTRLHKGASIIAIQTRWHEDDFIGRLLERSPKKWIRLRLPAIAEENDLLERKVGEPLAAGLGYDEDWAIEKKKEVGSKVWASLYQQRPTPESGDVIKREWIQYYKALPARLDRILISWDMTFKDKKDSDYVVGQCWGQKGADKYLIDQVRAKMGFTDTLKAVRAFKNKHPKAREILVEDKANGTAIIDALKREISGIIPIEPIGSKIARTEAVAPQFEAGNVYIPEDAAYTGDYVEELAGFPNAKNDDMVDASSQALNRFEGKKKTRVSNVNVW